MDCLIDTMMQLIKSEISKAPIDKSCVQNLSDDFLRKLYTLSKTHDTAHLIGDVLDKNNILPESAIADDFREQVFTAVYRYERIKYTYQQICDTLESAEIQFIPLKGIVIQDYYPEPWMRTSCDIDILVHREDLDRAATVIVKNLQYRKEFAGSHDVSLISTNGICLELHFDLLEDNRANSSNSVLQNVWEHACLRDGYKYLYDMDDSMFYFYHIAHMAKHFESGGCGIRPFLDLWLMNSSGRYSGEDTVKLLKQGDLFVFSNAVQGLSEVWFFGKEHDSTTLQMQEYILEGGVYGNQKNKTSIRQLRSGGKLNYVLSRVFLPYDQLKYQYPILQKHRWLTPFCEFYRWIELVFGRKAKNRKRGLKAIKKVSDEQVEQVAELLSNIGL
ncbi:MAG: nucleotidyltransferase family protein [Clostridia bacterium]|nr:nucleotidyltransferase family protein [Clostridia bacterium]